MTGRRFGQLLVQEQAGSRRTGLLWRCLCDCGTETIVQGTNLRNGHTQSCGHQEPQALPERFWAKVLKGDHCWEWQGAKTPKGYGCLRTDGELEYAHRISWRLAYGDPGELHVLHHCDNPKCVRPDHLFLGTRSDNMQDMVRKDRWGNQTRKGVLHV
jgi:hypothetical protein